jgi:hypothetical protein
MKQSSLWKVIVAESRDFFLDCVQPLILLGRRFRLRRN